ncbi:hypothetical protein LCI18_001525 [Fusarium solani-melongenae]|uniref:Uncharacterized protein n=1 Tax=Fusarium solani subsp. cucurbitae TaxID=2747967 RepID=A0ACD3YNT2_FUSSC|nr:hypothetical protein LCI18_001525 [Fusarium solani-melongenae]
MPLPGPGRKLKPMPCFQQLVPLVSFGNSYIYSIHEQDGGSSTISFYCPQPHLSSFASLSSLTTRSLPSRSTPRRHPPTAIRTPRPRQRPSPQRRLAGPVKVLFIMRRDKREPQPKRARLTRKNLTLFDKMGNSKKTSTHRDSLSGLDSETRRRYREGLVHNEKRQPRTTTKTLTRPTPFRALAARPP